MRQLKLQESRASACKQRSGFSLRSLLESRLQPAIFLEPLPLYLKTSSRAAHYSCNIELPSLNYSAHTYAHTYVSNESGSHETHT